MKHILSLILFGITLSGNAQQVLTLEQCLEQALQHNRTLQNAALDIQSATEQKKEAFTNYYPSISANVLAFQAFDKMMKGDGTIPQEIVMLGEQFLPYVGLPYSYNELNRGYSATISAIEPIYAGGQITTGNKLANIQKDVMVLQRQLTEKDVMQKVTENYWQVASVKYNLRTIEAAEKQLQAVYNLVEQYVKAGLTTRNDLLKVKLQMQELASNRLKAENGEHILRLLLAQQIGLANEDIDISLNEMDATQTPDNVYVPSNDAALQRIELQMAGKGVEAQELQVKMERGKNLPTFAVGVMGYHTGFGGISDNMKNYMNTTMTNGLVFGTLSVPISSWFGGTHAIRRQKIKLQQSQNDYLDAQEKLRIDVESAWSSLVEAYKQIDIAKASVEQSEENLRMCNDQYKAGSINLTDLLDAETLNRKAQDLLSNSKATYQIRLSDYLRKVRQ